jgi:hypothetical protein
MLPHFLPLRALFLFATITPYKEKAALIGRHALPPAKHKGEGIVKG